MKKVALILLVLCNLFVFSQGSWEKKRLQTLQNLHSVFFTDSLYGWIAGDSGIILHSINGGLTWEFQQTHTPHDVQTLFFLDRNRGWASAFNYTVAPYGTVLLKTTDGGATWLSYPYPKENVFITCIQYRDPMLGWMGGRPHAIVKTTDGGTTWTEAAVDTSTLAFFPVLDIQFYNDKYGYASGGMFDIAGVVWRTTNGGDRWSAMDPSFAPADEVHRLHLFDSIHVMGAGGDPDFGYGVGMINTSDGGLNWTYNELPIQGNAYDLDFRTPTEAWAPIGPRRQLIFSKDTGVTWTAMIAPDSAAIYDINFPDSLHGFAVGRDGAFLRYRLKGSDGIDEQPAGKSALITVGQNYPNPTSSSTQIPVYLNCESSLPGDVSVFITIFDISGREIAVIPCPHAAHGKSELSADVSGLCPGVYYYRAEIGGNGGKVIPGNTLKMIVL